MGEVLGVVVRAEGGPREARSQRAGVRRRIGGGGDEVGGAGLVGADLTLLPALIPADPRTAPRWSRVGTVWPAIVLVPASMAGLPVSRAMVRVGPPLFCSPFGSRSGSRLRSGCSSWPGEGAGDVGPAVLLSTIVLYSKCRAAGHVQPATPGTIVFGDGRVDRRQRAERVDPAAAGHARILGDGGIGQIEGAVRGGYRSRRRSGTHARWRSCWS